jgi:DNA-binding response OmpR family regulator
MSTASLATVETSVPTQPLSEGESDSPPGFRVVEGHLKDTMSLAGNKVLLLEDDAAFKEIMTDFLKESGFEVMAVQNGVEGVHQVLASDFEVILCDMMMPTLPGDMFFRAVERMRPHLCDRFVFMTGHRGNQKVNEFINSVSGTVLTKPFHVDDLLEMIAFVRLRTTLLAAA